MPVFISYALVVAIWSTTPMGIKLSNDSISSEAAVLLRMILASVFMLLFIACFKRNVWLKKANIPIYIVASIGLFPNMAVVYKAASYISSGMISVLFALTPIISGVMAAVVLKNEPISLRKMIAMLLAIAGVVLVFSDQMAVEGEAIKGILWMLLSGFLFSASQVGVKYCQRDHVVDASEQTLGALLFSLPGLLLSWCVFDGTIPQTIS